MYKAICLSLAIIIWVFPACVKTRIAGECPQTKHIRCMTRKICSEDKAQGCMKCTCESAWESDPIKEQERIRGRDTE